ncbi:hypothetical protein CONLIGDRAFT_683938 [Coniochaeta ligniaria NRRL 30616]|uniref:Uncharacterized protein n=1 Tax=Coniochaeta ligniaria NRRL 30616 TaxID=1408157 RepID=A0A1J7IHR6_9PEZI|nr:hypothetical protein CONLIGDRAFT_683938 [Coniochaeta ligniaria NRRL 30616]
MTRLSYAHVDDMQAPIVDNSGHDAQGERDVVIAVMGITEAGKSFMIRKMTGQAVLVGYGRKHSVKGIRFRYRSVNVTLLDSPGFHDACRTDTDILYDVSSYISDTYAQGFRLSGIIYLHPISHPQTEGSFRFSAFGCPVANEEGVQREKDPKAKFWKPFVD